MKLKLQKFFLLPRDDQLLFFQAGFLLMVIRLALWLLPFPDLIRLTARRKRPRNSPLHDDPARVNKIAWAVKSAAPCIPRATCLTQALAAQSLLKSRGIPAELRIGVAKDERGQFQAHAWISIDDRIIIGEAGHENYVPFGSTGISAASLGSCSLK